MKAKTIIALSALAVAAVFIICRLSFDGTSPRRLKSTAASRSDRSGPPARGAQRVNLSPLNPEKRKDLEREAQRLAREGTVEDFRKIILGIRTCGDQTLGDNLFMLLRSVDNGDLATAAVDDLALDNRFVLQLTEILGRFPPRAVIPHYVARLQAGGDSRSASWFFDHYTPDSSTLPVLWDAVDRIPRNDGIIMADQDTQQDLKRAYLICIANLATPENLTDLVGRVEAGQFSVMEFHAVTRGACRASGLSWNELVAKYGVDQKANAPNRGP
jgi:hypothetical protein